jgi:hypothetical protein
VSSLAINGFTCDTQLTALLEALKGCRNIKYPSIQGYENLSSLNSSLHQQRQMIALSLSELTMGSQFAEI